MGITMQAREVGQTCTQHINQSINQAVLLLQLNIFATKPTTLSSEFHFRRPKKISQEGKVGVSSQNSRRMIKNLFLVYTRFCQYAWFKDDNSLGNFLFKLMCTIQIWWFITKVHTQITVHVESYDDLCNVSF